VRDRLPSLSLPWPPADADGDGSERNGDASGDSGRDGDASGYLGSDGDAPDESGRTDTAEACRDGDVIELAGVTVGLGGSTIFEGVTTAVGRGRFVGLVGPNGAGKTTLLRTIAGVLAPDAGTVRVCGRDVHSLSSREASRAVAVVPQDTSLAFDFDVREVVSMGRTPYTSRFGRSRRADRDVVDDALARTDVAHLADRPVSEVSGGERQRILLARALTQDTPVLLLDEPTASLDINHQINTLELVRALTREGKTVVAAIHDLNLAAHYCDELLLLGDGRKLAEGSPESVLTEENLETGFGTRAAVTRHPVTGSVYVRALPERPAGGSEGRVHVVGGGGTAARLLYLLSAAGFEVTTGVLNEGDADLSTARSLGIEAVTVEPFAPIHQGARRDAEDLVADADVTVVADVEVGQGNLANLEIARTAATPVVVEERPFDERNYAGEVAGRVYETLCERGVVVSPDQVVSAVTERVSDASADADSAAPRPPRSESR
jgi:iron complex transport system ATP-binding protein